MCSRDDDPTTYDAPAMTDGEYRVQSHGSYPFDARAACRQCGWVNHYGGERADPNRVRNNTRAHVRRTGHDVEVVVTTATRYTRTDDV